WRDCRLKCGHDGVPQNRNGRLAERAAVLLIVSSAIAYSPLPVLLPKKLAANDVAGAGGAGGAAGAGAGAAFFGAAFLALAFFGAAFFAAFLADFLAVFLAAFFTPFFLRAGAARFAFDFFAFFRFFAMISSDRVQPRLPRKICYSSFLPRILPRRPPQHDPPYSAATAGMVPGRLASGSGTGPPVAQSINSTV